LASSSSGFVNVRHWPGYAVGIALAAGRVAAAQDSLPRKLPPVVTVTRDVGRSPLDLPYGITNLRPDSLAPGQFHMNVDQTLSLLPGVTVANRTNPSQDTRISVRGFGARSQFGARSIRLLRDGMPLTLPDGQTPIDYLDLESVERVEVIRGAAAALYGNAAGGVIDLRSGGVINLNGGAINAFNSFGLPPVGSINFNSGTVLIGNGNSVTLDYEVLSTVLGANPTLLSGRNLVVNGQVSFTSPVTLDGGLLSAGSISGGGNLLNLKTGTLNINSALNIQTGGPLGTILNVGPGMTINASSIFVGAPTKVVIAGGTLSAIGGVPLGSSDRSRPAAAFVSRHRRLCNSSCSSCPVWHTPVAVSIWQRASSR